MFAAEEAETRQTLRVRAAQPNPAPATQESIPPPLPRVRPRLASFIPPQQQQAVTRPITEADLVEAEAQLHGIPHLHPLANYRIHPDPLADLTRTDLQKVRNAALTEISRIMKDTKTAAETKKAAIKMTRVRDACRSTGVPFGELLEVEVEGFGMVPLIIEIVRCDFQQAPELLLFLLEHSSSKNLRWKVRRGCMLRNDSSNLYETLRHLVPSDSAGKPWDPPPFEYETSIEERLSTALLPPNLPPPSTDANEFRAMISIPNFPSSLLNDAIALAKRRHTPSEKLTGDPESESQRIDALLRAEAGLVVEFIACKKCWTLEVGSNRLVLTLVDGEPVRVADARVTVVKEERPALPRLKIEPIPGLENLSSGGGPRRSLSEGETAKPVAVPQSVRRNTPPSPVPDRSNQYGQQGGSPYGTLPRSGGPSRTPICPAVADLFKSLPPPRMSTSPPEVHFTLEPPTPLRRVPQPNSITDPDFFSTEPNATSSSNIDIALNSPSLNGPAPPRPPRPARPLLLPRATLHPIHYSKGQHRTVLAPCFPNYATTTSFVKSVLSSKELLIELVVRLEKVNAPHHALAAAFQQPLDSGDEDEELVGTGMEVRRASVGGRSLFSGEDGGDSDVEVSSVVPESVNLITFSEDTHEKLPGPSGSGSGTAPAKGQKPKRPTLLIPGTSPSGARSHSAEWSPVRSSSYHL